MSFTDFGAMPQGRVVNMGANGVGEVAFGSDASLFVVIEDYPVLNKQKSAEAGRPIHDKIPYIRIQQPGDNLSVIHRPITEADKRRFAGHWQNYLNGRGDEQPGTPISVLFPYSPEIVEDLKAIKITTVEHLATASGTDRMGLLEWQQKATKYLEAAKDSAVFTKMEKVNEELRAEVSGLKQQLAEIRQMLAQRGQGNPATQQTYDPDAIDDALGRSLAESPQKRGPGRPRKEPYAA